MISNQEIHDTLQTIEDGLAMQYGNLEKILEVHGDVEVENVVKLSHVLGSMEVTGDMIAKLTAKLEDDRDDFMESLLQKLLVFRETMDDKTSIDDCIDQLRGRVYD
jgi:hypothetical protein